MSDVNYIEDDVVVKEKIKSAFSNVCWSELNGLIQFWAPVNIEGRRLLSTFDQPSVVIDSFIGYRLCCEKYHYCIDHNKVKDDNEVMGAPTSAFMTHLSVVVHNNMMMMTPEDFPNQLELTAFESGLTCYFMLPVFYPCQQKYFCVGVVECCITTA